MATAYTWYDWDWANAEKEFHRALELNPNDALGRNWYGGYLSLRGRHDEAIDEHERARELDPFSLIINANLARSFYWARRYDEAIVQARKTLQMDPHFGVAAVLVGRLVAPQKPLQGGSCSTAGYFHSRESTNHWTDLQDRRLSRSYARERGSVQERWCPG